jgi:hypothetical protein
MFTSLYLILDATLSPIGSNSIYIGNSLSSSFMNMELTVIICRDL